MSLMALISIRQHSSWNPKHPKINGCVPLIVKNPYTIDGCLEKPPLITDSLGSRWFQDVFPIHWGQLKHDRPTKI